MSRCGNSPYKLNTVYTLIAAINKTVAVIFVLKIQKANREKTKRQRRKRNER
nr:MAG TPA: hypothetical protein [Caudoviricetes sp.]